MPTQINDYDPQAIFDNWILLQPLGDRARAMIDHDPPLRGTLPADWPEPRAAYRLRSGEQQNLAVLRRVVETVPGARVTVSVSACVQTGDNDDPPRSHNIQVNNKLVVALDPEGNNDLFAATVRQDDIPILYDWRGYELRINATGRQVALYAGIWWGKDNQYPVKKMNFWLRHIRVTVETPETAPPPGPGPISVPVGPLIEMVEPTADGKYWRVVSLWPKA